jgi:hypothetical protein
MHGELHFETHKQNGFRIVEPIHNSDWDRNSKPDQHFVIAKLIA